MMDVGRDGKPRAAGAWCGQKQRQIWSTATAKHWRHGETLAVTRLAAFSFPPSSSSPLALVDATQIAGTGKGKAPFSLMTLLTQRRCRGVRGSADKRLHPDTSPPSFLSMQPGVLVRTHPCHKSYRDGRLSLPGLCLGLGSTEDLVPSSPSAPRNKKTRHSRSLSFLSNCSTDRPCPCAARHPPNPGSIHCACSGTNEPFKTARTRISTLLYLAKDTN
jgi:hypothetical protein